MLKQLLLSVILLSLSQLANAYRPTVESLFRNGSNGDVEQKTVIANLLIEAISDTNQEQNSSSFNTKLELPKYTTVKMLFYNDGQKNTKLVQLDYSDASFSSSKIAKLHYKNNLGLQSIGLLDENVDGRFFYAIMSSLLNNNGSLVIELAKSLGSSIKLNKELVNQEKYQLLGRYKRYLEKKIKANEDQSIQSPLISEDSEKQNKIDEIMNQKFYHDSSYVIQEKEGDHFYWLVRDNIVLAKFTDQARHLKFVKLNTPSGNVEMVFRDYILYNSTHEFPREILFRTSFGKEFKISLKKLSVLEDSSENMSRRIQKYKESISDNNIQAPILKPSFLL